MLVTCEKPEFYVKSPTINRSVHSEFNSDLSKYVVSDSMANDGDVCVLEVVTWLQENAKDYIERSKDAQKKVEPTTKANHAEGEEEFVRYWIYSHHIYSKIKRRDILDLSKEFQLTGFSMPGKPGIVCLEGVSGNVAEAWSIIKSWNWKKINVKLQEE